MYVDAFYDKHADCVRVVERVNGKRIENIYPAEYTFYYEDSKGKYRSIYDKPLSKFTTTSHKTFYAAKKRHNGPFYESDIRPIARALEREYKNSEPPKLHTGFFDIEVDFDKERGHAPVTDPFNQVTAISIYLDWADQLVTLAIPPKDMTWEEAEAIAEEFDNTFLYADDKDLLNDFLDIIEDVDVLSGWNSEGFDIPYLVNRVKKVLSQKDLTRFCLWNQIPLVKTVERYGVEQEIYDLCGRIQLDYMQLYKKYTYHEMHSYSLDAISEHELDEHKTPYEGTLDQLYNDDFYTFLEYNRQDAMLVYRLDKKLKFIDLANLVAHDNTVQIPKILGTVGVTEQAIINETHDRGMVVPDKVSHEGEDTKAVGAYVVEPKVGLHQWIGSVDINSLYPSTFRALNMSPETLIGQIRPTLTDPYIAEKMKDKVGKKGKTKKGDTFAAAWDGIFATLEYTAVMEERDDIELIIDWEDGGPTKMLASDIYKLIFSGESNWCLTANASIFTYEKDGIIPQLLARWYKERQELQAKKDKAIDMGDEEAATFWNQRQHSKKIMLNALYGALLNAHCRFWNKSIGQSTTLTGRSIAKHMHSYVNKMFTGEYDFTGKAIAYGDTDSVAGDSKIRVLDDGVESTITIEELFHKGNYHWNQSTKEFSKNDGIKIIHSGLENKLKYVNYNYIYRHKVSKKRYRIKTNSGNSVVVTEDHSIMVLENNELIEKKPKDLKPGDKVISVSDKL